VNGGRTVVIDDHVVFLLGFFQSEVDFGGF